MKFDQLIEYNIIRSIFVGKSCPKCDGEAIPRPLSKKSKISISLDQQSFIQFLFIVCQVERYLKIQTEPQTT